jgi:hypothetical protein
MEEKDILDCQMLQDKNASGKVRTTQLKHPYKMMLSYSAFISGLFLSSERYCKSLWWARN